MIFIGIDWAEDSHDSCVLGDDGDTIEYGPVSDDLAGVTRLHELFAGLVEDQSDVVIGIETDQGLFVRALVEAGYQVHAINPLAADRYRDRHHVSGAKSDPADAKMLADLVRTDRHNHRLIAEDSTLVRSIKALARAHQSLIWSRTRTSNQLRAVLQSFYPAAVVAFKDLTSHDAVGVLATAPTPTLGLALSRSKLKAALKRGGRQRYLDRRADEIAPILRAAQLDVPADLETANGDIVTALVDVIVTYNRQIGELETKLTDRFETHPDAEIVRSQPGVGVVLGARELGEFGDDPARYRDVKSRRNTAGTSPITITSGKRRIVQARYATNDRLLDAFMQQAFCSLLWSEGARAYYDTKYAAHQDHNKALRSLANRLVGILHGCLKTRTLYNEEIAWAAHNTDHDEDKREEIAEAA